MPKSEIARHFDCSRQTIYRIAGEIRAKRTSPYEMSELDVSAKRDFDVAFNAFERCSSPENYRRLDKARRDYESIAAGQLSRGRGTY